MPFDLGGVGKVSEKFEHLVFYIVFNGELASDVTSGGRAGLPGNHDRRDQFSKTFH